MGGRDFIIELRKRYVRFEGGAARRAAEERQRLQRQRSAHRASRNIVPPPFTADEVVRRGRPPKAPRI